MCHVNSLKSYCDINHGYFYDNEAIVDSFLRDKDSYLEPVYYKYHATNYTSAVL